MDSRIASLIEVAESGKASASDLFKALYDELHWLANRELARRSDVGVGATSLLHEAYLRMAAHNGAGPSFPDRARFMAYAARVMRGLIIDHARSQRASKRGGGFEFTALTTQSGENVANAQELEKIGAALDELAEADPSLAEIVDLKFFCGFTLEEIAGMKGLSERTMRRKWDKARLYLYDSIRADVSH